MAHLAVSQASVAVPVGSDYTLSSSSLFKTLTLRFGDKSWAALLSLDLKSRNAQLKNRHVLCMSVEQAGGSKVAVSPLELEEPNEPPLNIYEPKEPYTATIVSVERLVGPKAPGETCHIVIVHGGNVPYWEGQSCRVITPKPRNPHNVCLHSIASTTHGDSFDGKTASLCVHRAVYYDPETGKDNPSKNGVCGNFLFNSKAGDKFRSQESKQRALEAFKMIGYHRDAAVSATTNYF